MKKISNQMDLDRQNYKGHNMFFKKERFYWKLPNHDRFCVFSERAPNSGTQLFVCLEHIFRKTNAHKKVW